MNTQGLQVLAKRRPAACYNVVQLVGERLQLLLQPIAWNT